MLPAMGALHLHHKPDAKLWEGHALIGAKVSKVTTNVINTTHVIKQAPGLPLADDGKRVETASRQRDKIQALPDS
jgi:DNA sulfur modification protein DndB